MRVLRSDLEAHGLSYSLETRQDLVFLTPRKFTEHSKPRNLITLAKISEFDEPFMLCDDLLWGFASHARFRQRFGEPFSDSLFHKLIAKLELCTGGHLLQPHFESPGARQERGRQEWLVLPIHIGKFVS